MKAPDKVFFPNDINLLTKLSLVIKQKDDVCYIRKDTLLEWLEALKVQAFEIREDDGGDVFYGSRIELLEEVVNKIESL